MKWDISSLSSEKPSVFKCRIALPDISSTLSVFLGRATSEAYGILILVKRTNHVDRQAPFASENFGYSRP